MEKNLEGYLRAIQAQMGAGVGVVDHAQEHLMFCMRSLIVRCLAQDELTAAARSAWIEALPPLLAQLGADPSTRIRCRTELDELQAMMSADIEIGRLQSCLGRLTTQLLRAEEPSLQMIARSLVAVDLGHWDRIQVLNSELMASSQTGEEQTIDRIDAASFDRLAAWLRDTFGEGDDFHIVESSTIPGGFSKQTTFVTLAGNRHLPSHVVIRRDRPESPAGSTVLDEFPLLQCLHSHGVKVPQPLAIDGQKVTGNPIMVLSREGGSIVADNHVVHDRTHAEVRLRGLAQQHALFHRIPVDSLPSGIRGSNVEVRQFVEEEVIAFRNNWRQLGESSLIMDAAFEWLLCHLQFAEGARGLVHNDSRLQNVLVDDRGVCALLDWEMATIGNPARDLAYVHEHVTQLGDWRCFLGWYAEAGGIVPSEDTIRFYQIWANLWNCTFGWIARSLFLRGAIDSLPIAYVGEEFRERNLRLVARHLHAAMGGIAP